jgi:hypothetical protein
VYSSLAGLGTLSLSVADTSGANFSCVGVATQCAIDDGVCQSGNNTISQWVASRGAGTFKVVIYQDDVTGPCAASRKLTTVTVTR